MAPDPTPSFDPETKPPLFEDALDVDPQNDPNHNAFPAESTTSGTELAIENGIDVGTDSPVDPDDRTDLEGPDVLPEDDGTLTHPSFGGGVRLNTGMGTGAGEDEDAGEPLYTPESDGDETDDSDEDSKGLGYIPDANGN
ncbi:hypothetical protein EON77_17125 [bacterium]|nr:MAG: hypothetical protein EON77_17125 [bacterium]